MIVAHYVMKTSQVGETSGTSPVARKVLDLVEPVPAGAVWLDMVEPTVAEDQKVELYLGCKVPSRADPDFTEPPEAYYADNGVRYLQGSFVSEPEDTPDVTGITFVLTPNTLVTVRYDPGDAFELFGQRLCKSGVQALHPDAVAVGLINTIVNRSARALNRVGVELELDRQRGLPGQGRPGREEPDLFRDPRRAWARGREDFEPARKPGVDRAAVAVPVVGGTLCGRAKAGARGDEVGAA